MNKPELLAPAGSFKKLETALLYGADAVYVGGKDFSLRAYADNLDETELIKAVDLAHSKGAKVYVTVNIFPKNSDFPKAERYFKYLESIGADAALVTDAGFISLAKNVAPSLPLHLSTQANTLNKYAVRFWAEQGISRVVLARELAFEEIAEIAAYNPSTEIETFVHGAMCISYSGRCLLSNYLAGRDGNRGECVQACRWHYRITETARNESAELVEDERGAYILNSKDLNLLREIPRLAQAGVKSFKIEGRMKSEYYLATVVNAYRRAIDEYCEYGEIISADALEAETLKVTHRDYTKAYFDGTNAETVSYASGQHAGSYEFVGAVKGYADGKAVVEMRNRFRTGETLEVLSPGESFNRTFVVGEMTNAAGEKVTDAKLVQEILYLDVPFPLTAGDILRRKS